MIDIDIKPTFFDEPKKLIIEPDMISFKSSSVSGKSAIQFSKGEVAAFRFGVKPIRGYRFNIGRKYFIDIKGLDDRVIKIRLLSLYGIRKKALHNRFNMIVNAFFNTHQQDILNYYLEVFNSDISVNILDTAFTGAGIEFNGRKIPWNDVGSKTYHTYFALFSKSSPTIYKSYNYLQDWNTAVVYSLSMQILMDKGFILINN